MSPEIIKKFRESKKAQAIFCLLGLIFAGSFFLWTSGISIGSLFPSNEKLEAARRELKKASSEVTEQENRQQQMVVLEKSYKEFLATAWDNERDGDPDLELRKKIEEAARKHDFKLSNIGTVQRSRINSDLYFLEMSVDAIETLDILTLFLQEIENSSPKMYWKKADFAPENMMYADRVRFNGIVRLLALEPVVAGSKSKESTATAAAATTTTGAKL